MVIGNDAIRETFCDATIKQIQNCKASPGVTEVVLNPDAPLGTPEGNAYLDDRSSARISRR